MLIHLHKTATTTPKVRAAIQASAESASVLAERFGTTEQTVYKRRHRDAVHDRSHTPHRLEIETEQNSIRGIVFPTRVAPGHRRRLRWFCAKPCWPLSTTCWRWSASS